MAKKRATGGDPENPTAAELRRRMEEARDSITETVSEIKTVVAHQYEEVKDTYETVKEGVGEVLDWREQFERNPIVWGAGAVSVGILVGLGLAHVFDEDDEPRGRRRKSKEPAAGERVLSELTGLADAVLPTISGKIKELFGLDLGDYVRHARERRAAATPPRRLAAKGAAKKRAAAKRPASAKKTTAKKGGARRRREG